MLILRRKKIIIACKGGHDHTRRNCIDLFGIHQDGRKEAWAFLAGNKFDFYDLDFIVLRLKRSNSSKLYFKEAQIMVNTFLW